MRSLLTGYVQYKLTKYNRACAIVSQLIASKDTFVSWQTVPFIADIDKGSEFFLYVV